MAGLGREPHRLAARRRRLPDVARAAVAPGDVGHPGAVGGRRGRVLARRQVGAAGGDPHRRAVEPACGERLLPDTAERVEHDPAAVRRLRRPAQDARLQRSGVDPLLPGDARRRPLLDLGHERDLDRSSRREVDPDEPVVTREHDRAAVGREVEAGIEVGLRESLHLVAGELAQQDSLGAGRELAQHEHRVAVAAADVRHPEAVRRKRRAARAADPFGHRAHFGVDAVVAPDLPEPVLEIGDVVERTLARGEVEEASVGGGHRSGGVVQVVARGELDAGAAAAVVEPELDRREPRGLPLLAPREQVFAVGRPVGSADVGVLLLGQRARVRAVGVGEPEVLDPAAVAGEGDRPPVGREARLRVPGRARSQTLRAATRDRQRVEVAQQVEDQRRAVGRHVHRRPGRFARLEGDAARIGARLVDVRGSVRRRRRCLRRCLGGIGDGRREQGDEDERGERGATHARTSGRIGSGERNGRAKT